MPVAQTIFDAFDSYDAILNRLNTLLCSKIKDEDWDGLTDDDIINLWTKYIPDPDSVITADKCFSDLFEKVENPYMLRGSKGLNL